MNYELAKELKDAGFPQDIHFVEGHIGQPGKNPGESGSPEEWEEYQKGFVYAPTLSELIEACGETFYGLHRLVGGTWLAFMYDTEDSTRQVEEKGTTPEEAVARLWLALNQKTS